MISRRLLIGLLALALAVTLAQHGRASPADKARVLVYSGSTGYRHESIPAAVEAIKAIGDEGRATSSTPAKIPKSSPPKISPGTRRWCW